MSDTAGIRNSKDEIENKGIKLALKKAEDADLNLLVFEPKNVDFTSFLKGINLEKSIFIINKSDLGDSKIKILINSNQYLFQSKRKEY